MTANDTDADEDNDDGEEEKSIDQKVKEHIERRKDAYVKMGTVDSDPDE